MLISSDFFVYVYVCAERCQHHRRRDAFGARAAVQAVRPGHAPKTRSVTASPSVTSRSPRPQCTTRTGRLLEGSLTLAAFRQGSSPATACTTRSSAATPTARPRAQASRRPIRSLPLKAEEEQASYQGVPARAAPPPAQPAPRVTRVLPEGLRGGQCPASDDSINAAHKQVRHKHKQVRIEGAKQECDTTRNTHIVGSNED